MCFRNSNRITIFFSSGMSENVYYYPIDGYVYDCYSGYGGYIGLWCLDANNSCSLSFDIINLFVELNFFSIFLLWRAKRAIAGGHTYIPEDNATLYKKVFFMGDLWWSVPPPTIKAAEEFYSESVERNTIQIYQMEIQRSYCRGSRRRIEWYLKVQWASRVC